MIRPVAAVVAVPGRAMLPLPQGAAIYRQAPTMSPCRRRAAPSRQEPSIAPPAQGTSARPAVTRLRYFPHARRRGELGLTLGASQHRTGITEEPVFSAAMICDGLQRRT